MPVKTPVLCAYCAASHPVHAITQPDDVRCAGGQPVHPQLMMYKCVAKPWVMRLGALILGAASFMVVWSEATIGLGRKPDVSPFSLVLTLPSCATPHNLLLRLLLVGCARFQPFAASSKEREQKKEMLCQLVMGSCIHLLRFWSTGNESYISKASFLRHTLTSTPGRFCCQFTSAHHGTAGTGSAFATSCQITFQ